MAEAMAMKAATSSPGAVQATNDDASASKLSCVKKGYIQDDFVHFFVKRPIKRAPLINRGYYARWAAIRKLLLQFLDSVGPKQILSLGAGFDTTYFQLEEEGRGEVKYVELDFLEVTSRKAAIIASREQLQKKVESLGTISPERGEIHSKQYMLLPVDLRDINSLEKAFECAQLDISVPTFILSECVLIYLDPDVSRAVVNWAAQKFNTAVFVVYEQYSPEDAFGQQMIKNLESRGCPLLGIHDTPSLEAKRERFTKNGWPRAVALNMDDVYRSEIDPIDRRRIERLEIFDEFEEWHMMQEHYCLAYGIKDATSATWKGWDLDQHIPTLGYILGRCLYCHCLSVRIPVVGLYICGLYAVALVTKHEALAYYWPWPPVVVVSICTLLCNG